MPPGRSAGDGRKGRRSLTGSVAAVAGRKKGPDVGCGRQAQAAVVGSKKGPDVRCGR